MEESHPFKGLWSELQYEEIMREAEAQQQTAAEGNPDPPLLIGGSKPPERGVTVPDFTYFSKEELVKEFMRLSIKLDGLRGAARYVESGADAFKQVAEERQAVISALAQRGIDVSALV